MACVYDDTLQDDCTTPITAFGPSPLIGPPSPNAPTPNPDYNFVPISDTSDNPGNPVAALAGSSSGSSSLGQSVLNFFGAITPTILKATTGTGATTGLRLQVNPATGQSQYYNPATGQYVGGPVNTTGNFFSGNSGFLLIIIALVVAFFAFGGRKRLAAA